MLCKPIVVTFLLASLLLILTGCGGGSSSSSSTTVPASFTPLIGNYVASWSRAGAAGNSTFDVSIQSVQDPTGQSNSQVLELKTSGTTPPWGYQMDCFTAQSFLAFDSTGTKIVSAVFFLNQASPSWGNPSIELDVSNGNITGTINDYAGGSSLAVDHIPYQFTLSNNSVTTAQK